MADAVDIEPDLVADRNVRNRRYFDVAGADGRVSTEIGLRARLADLGDRGHLILLNGTCNGGIGVAVAEGDLFADLESVDAGDRHVVRAGGNGDDWTVGEGLPERGAGTG